jgi:subtilisin family serine protease
VTTPRVGIIDTGVNPWHSHVGGRVDGCRLFLDGQGRIREDGDFRDPVGHGTAVAGLVREGLPAAALFAVRVFDGAGATYPSLVARAILRAAAAGCEAINLSLSLGHGPASELVVAACEAAVEAGCLLVAPEGPTASSPWAAVPDVFVAVADDRLAFGEVREVGPRRFAAPGRPRDLRGLPREANLWGSSFACARVTAHLCRAPAP